MCVYHRTVHFLLMSDATIRSMRIILQTAMTPITTMLRNRLGKTFICWMTLPEDLIIRISEEHNYNACAILLYLFFVWLGIRQDFLVCWITLHRLKFFRSAIAKKKTKKKEKEKDMDPIYHNFYVVNQS